MLDAIIVIIIIIIQVKVTTFSNAKLMYETLISKEIDLANTSL